MEPEQVVQICTLPPRPKGLYSRERFKEVEITTNFYPVDIKNIECIHIFKIHFTPFIMFDDRPTKNRVLEKAMPQIRKNIRNPVISGMNIYSEFSPDQQECTVTVDEYQVQIKEVKVIKVKENPKMLVQFLNNGLRNLMSRINYVEIGKTGKYFNINCKQKIENLMMFSGYKANFMELQRGVFLRVDTAKKIVRNQTVLTAINQIYKLHGDKEREEKRALVKSELVDKIIMTNYGKTRYHRIIDIEFEDIDSVMIPEEQTSIRDYFIKKYNIKIQQTKQPLLVVENKRNDKKIYMVPQLCLMTGIPDDFDEFRRKKISEATIKSAEERKKQIQGLMNEIKNTNEIDSLKEIGIKIDKNMETFKAKLIPPPRLALGNEERVEQGRQSFFNLFAQPIFASKHSIRLGLVYFRSTDSHQIIELFEETSKKLKVDMKIAKLNIGDFESRRAISAIDKYVSRAAEQEGCNICLVIIPNQLKSQYKKIKEACLVNNSIICQIATEGTLKKKNFRSIATKILLQMIAKRGNTLWVPQSIKKMEKTMLMAFDSSKCGKKNVLSGVATVNSTFSSICSRIEEFTGATDKLQGMFSLMMKLIDAYVSRNKQPPEEVIAFANSCSTDQVKLYQEFFLMPATQKLAEIYGLNPPKVTFVLANTKTNERFFQIQGSNVRNVPAGTIVSENIVSKNYDFFMVSQFANRGSTVPNHYRVIYSNSKIQEGVLQELIYSQCFNYVNWTGSIKVPGILQYAKKCARFNTEVLEVKKLSEQLETKLYFI